MVASNNVIVVSRKLSRFLIQHGLRETIVLTRKNVAAAIRHLMNRRFDRKYNVDTSGVIHLAKLTCEGANKDHGVWYEPTPPRTLKLMFSMLPDDLSAYVFIDFGSGKGRTLFYASSYNFKRIIGVEFARELHELALQNISRLQNRSQRCFALDSVCADASTFDLPNENCVLYFFHPFQQDVMARVLANIQASYRRHPRKLLLLYYYPRPETVREIESVGFARTSEKLLSVDLAGEPSRYPKQIALFSTPDEVDSRSHPVGSVAAART